MTPDDLSRVQRSWSELRRHRAPFLVALTRRLDEAGSAADAAVRAHWLFDATEELIGLLSAPSCLEARARALGETWPDPLTAPSFRVDGRAWLAASAGCVATWSEATEAAWRQAWLLLSDVLANEALSPFADDQVADPTSSKNG